jgi:RNA polymerase primary sigma factor
MRRTLLTQSEERRLCAIYQGSLPGDRDNAWRTLEEKNKGLITSIARKFIGGSYAFEDAEQDATIGFHRACLKFDGTRGIKLSTYAAHWITQTLARGKEQMNAGSSIRLPSHIHEKLALVARRRSAFTAEHGRAPTIEELSAITDMTEKQLEALQEVPNQALSLDARLPGYEDVFLIDTLSDHNSQRQYHGRSIQEALDMEAVIEGFLSCLPKQSDREVLRMRYLEEMSYTEIGEYFGMTKQSAQYRESGALRFIRRYFGLTQAERGVRRPRSEEELAARDAKVLEDHRNGVDLLQLMQRYDLGEVRVRDIIRGVSKKSPTKEG